MYIARLQLNQSRLALTWASNPYRVHQRLKMAYDRDPRLLFRIEENQEQIQILVQSMMEPNWGAAFAEFAVLAGPPEYKLYEPVLQEEITCRFRLLANPTVKKTVEKEGQAKKQRLGLLSEKDQEEWLLRKLSEAGARLLEYRIIPRGLQRSRKAPSKAEGMQTHLAVLYEGTLVIEDPSRMLIVMENGIGPGKGYGFGLLSLARS
jgi:CRISPR system Cascade subunit CasE